MKTFKVRLDGLDGLAMPEKTLKTVYASGLDFEPDERRLRITPDGMVELQVSRQPCMIHAKITVPMYGQLWVTVDNQGEGYSGDFADFVPEAVRSYIAWARHFSQGVPLSVKTQAHLDAAVEFEHLANRGMNTPVNRLYALSHALYAAEGALFERARQALIPRNDLRLGCNFMRYTSPSARYASFFANAFDFATLPFYPSRTVPARGKYDYSYIDSALSYLAEKGITPKGHPLFFGHKEVNPTWMFGLDYPVLRREAEAIARHHVKSYRGVIDIWDTMNEAHDWANCFDLTQEQLIDLTKATAGALREASDRAVSVINVCLPFAEYVAGRYTCYGALPEHLRSPLQYFRDILEAGVDFDAVGIQLYFPGRDMVTISRMLDAYAALGKPIHITEMGVNGGFRTKDNTGSGWSQLDMSEGTWHGGWNEHTQADWMEQFYTIAAARKEIRALTWWDFMEPSFFGNGAFLYEDENPREIYFRFLALRQRLKA